MKVFSASCSPFPMLFMLLASILIAQSATGFTPPVLPVVQRLEGGARSSLSRIKQQTISPTQLFSLMDFLNEGKKALVKQFAGDYDEAKIRERVNTLIADHDVLMLSFTTCPFCIKAKECLQAKNAKFTAIELDQDADGKAIRAVLGDMVGRTSVPAIWINGEFIGGCNDGPMGGLLQLDKQGKLDEMLRNVGAL